MSEIGNLFDGGFISDEDESLKAKSVTNFGLNTGAVITKFEHNPNAGKDGSPTDALDIEITLGTKRFMTRFFEINKVFSKGKNSVEITDTTSEEYIAGYNEAAKAQKGIITHYLKVFYTEAEIGKAFANASLKSFADYYKFVAEAVQLGMKRKGPEVDIFLQYQWQIKSGQDITYLELPKNMKDGSFICKPIACEGKWNEVRNADGLSYVDDKGNLHRFKRDASFLTSAKGFQQSTKTKTSTEGVNAMAGNTADGSTPPPAKGTGGW